MTSSSEQEPEPADWVGYDAWAEAVQVARRERRQRGERYKARHRGTSDADDDGADTKEASQGKDDDGADTKEAFRGNVG